MLIRISIHCVWNFLYLVLNFIQYILYCCFLYLPLNCTQYRCFLWIPFISFLYEIALRGIGKIEILCDVHVSSDSQYRILFNIFDSFIFKMDSTEYWEFKYSLRLELYSISLVSLFPHVLLMIFGIEIQCIKCFHVSLNRDHLNNTTLDLNSIWNNIFFLHIEYHWFLWLLIEYWWIN